MTNAFLMSIGSMVKRWPFRPQQMPASPPGETAMSEAASRSPEAMLIAESANITLVKIAVRSELPERGKVREFMASGRMLCVANVEDNIYATDNACLHWGGPLEQ